jgi:flagellar basal-body rod modification protein FlgD
MEVNDTSLSANNGLSPAKQQTESSIASAASDFDTFLKLLTAQLRNQDPTSPLDSTQFVEQLASFSAVEQQIETNKRLETLAENLAVSGLEGATQWVGKQVEAASNAARFQGEALNFVIPKSSVGDSTEITISDATGKVVYSEQTDNQRRQFSWGGKNNDGDVVQNGDYVISINRMTDGKVVEASPALSLSRVLEARLEGSDVKLVLSNGGLIKPGEITAVLDSLTQDATDKAS